MLKNVIIIIELIAILILGGVLYNRTSETETFIQKEKIEDAKKTVNPYKDANISFELIEVENQTWGYKIILEGSSVIIQKNKPGLPGKEGFKTKGKAQKIAKLVIEKIRNGQMPPTITFQELKDINAL